MKPIFKILILLFCIQSYAQVGINTTTPEAQFDIKASNQATPANTDGIIIPRIDAFPAINPTVAQQGMMIYLMVTSGANLPGFYYWDNTTTSWIGISSTANGDKDWYKVGTTTAPSAITDDMFHNGKVGIGNTNPFTKLHVMNNSSGMTPNTESVVTLEDDTNAFLNILSPLSTGVVFGANGNSTNGGIIYNPSYLLNSMLFRTNGNVNRMIISDIGNIALGNFIPSLPLQFPSILGDKLSLYGSAGPHYGFGIQNALMQIHSAGITDDIAFGYGSSAAFTERMRIKGNGNVGIGLTNPSSRLHVENNSSGMTPNPFAITTIENDDLTFLNLLSTGESGIVFGAGTNNSSGGIIYNHPSLLNGIQFRTNNNINRMTISDVGNVAIGNFKADFPLQFTATLGDKISLWGGTGNHHGFGVQNSLLQIHSDVAVSDIAFGYGSSAAFTERMRIKGDGNVGIGLINPQHPLQFATSTGDKISLYGGTGAHYGFGIQGNLMQIHSDLVGSDIAFGYGSSGAFTEGVRIRGNGNVGIGVIVPEHPLQFKSAVGDKISLYGGTGAHYGFGIQAFTMQIHSAGVTDDIAFGYGSSAAFTERMRIKGDGNVGIGTPTPTAELEVNGFTKLGSTAPAIKVIKLTGTTGAAQGNSTFIAHTVTTSKIVAVNVLVEYATDSFIPPSYNGSAGYEYDFYINGANIVIWTKSGNSATILSKPIRVLLTYEE